MDVAHPPVNHCDQLDGIRQYRLIDPIGDMMTVRRAPGDTLEDPEKARRQPENKPETQSLLESSPEKRSKKAHNR